MIRIFGPTERSFKSNGLQVIDKYVIDPQIHEELNGIYEFTFSIPISKSSNIERENIVVVDTPLDNNQAFRITQVRKEDGLYHVTCFHIFYDLIHNMIEDINIVGSGATNALRKINEGCVESHPFSFHTDITDKVANCRIVRYNPVQAIIGTDDNTFVNRWGGEIERNNFNVFMRGKRGTDKGIRIEYKKNLLGYECEIDYSQITTKIMPKGAEELLLPEKYVESDNISKYANTKIKVIEFNDIKAKKEEDDFESEGLPLNEAYAELRRLSQLQFDVNHIDLPRANYKVNFIDLSKTREYKHLKQLEKVYLGDTVHVLHKKENLDIEARVISYTYNPLNKRYIEIELGNFMEGLTSLKKEIDKINEQINNDIATALEEAKENATNLIKKGFGGHVRIYPDRILIMDNEDETQAKQVWQWNKNGFGYSNTGIDGQYGLAMTMDGSIVADFITTGSLTASMIRSGLLTGKNFNLDLDSGKFRLGQSDSTYTLLYDGNTLHFGEGDKKITVNKYGDVSLPPIEADDIPNNSITSTKISPEAVTAPKIATNAITANHIKAGTITSNEIKTGAITTDFLYPGQNERIVLEKGYPPGSNDAKSIDANGNYIRLKYNDGSYMRLGDTQNDFFFRGRSVATIDFSGVKSTGGRFAELSDSNNNYLAVTQGLSMNVLKAGETLKLDPSGNLWIRGGLQQWSDISLKSNIKYLDSNDVIKERDREESPLTSSDCTDFIKKCKTATYFYEPLEKSNLGIIAQDVKNFSNISKYMITKDKKDNKLRINTFPYITVLHTALQEEMKRNDELEKRIERLEKLIEKGED